MSHDTTTDPSTLADELRAHAARPFDFYAWCTNTDRDPASDEALDIWTDVGGDPYELAVLATSAADLIDDLATEVLELRARMRADLEAHALPDGWTAKVFSHSGVTVKHDTYPHGRSSIYVGCVGADDFAWSVKLHDDDEWTTAATLADVVTAYLAAGR